MGYINPLMQLPEAREILALPVDQRRALASLMTGLNRTANAEAEVAWKRRKGPMACYWRSVATYTRHVRHLLAQERDDGDGHGLE